MQLKPVLRYCLVKQFLLCMLADIEDMQYTNNSDTWMCSGIKLRPFYLWRFLYRRILIGAHLDVNVHQCH